MIKSSTILKASNNIVRINTKQDDSYRQAKNQYNRTILTIESKIIRASRKKLPDLNDIRNLSNFVLTSKFRVIGDLIQRFASGALDTAGLIRSFFPGKDSKIGSPPKNDRNISKPKVVGGKLKLSGIRALGIVNALFAGLDFAEGISGGESIGKAASGAAGSLAGSLIGGIIGQSLIPIPGLGFVVGSSIGGFIGGYGADRAYEGLTGAKKKQEEKLKDTPKGEPKVEAITPKEDIQNLNFLVKRFEIPVNKFKTFVKDVLEGKIRFGGLGSPMSPTGTQQAQPQTPPGAPMGQLEEMEATGGRAPGVSNSPFGWRWGRMHKGNDYAEPSGTPISIIQPGVVTIADMNYDPEGWGAVVQIRHKDGSSTLYGHLSAIRVKQGQEVVPGTVIGNVGSTGRSTGPHLHFEYILPDGKTRVDPTKVAPSFFRFGGDVKVKPKPSPEVNLGSSQSQETSSNITPVPADRYITMEPRTSTVASQQMQSRDLNYNFAYNNEVASNTLIIKNSPEIIMMADNSKGASTPPAQSGSENSIASNAFMNNYLAVERTLNIISSVSRA